MNHDSQIDFNSFTEITYDVISQTDEKGYFQNSSPSFSKLLGYSQESIVGENAFDYIHDEDQKAVKQWFQELIQGKSENSAEYRFKHSQGYYVWLETTGRVLLNQEKKITGAIFNSRDIRDRKILEEKQFNFLSLSIDMLGTANTKGYFVEINQSWVQTLGWSVDELLSKPYLSLVHPEDCEETIKMGDRLLKGEKVYSFVNRYLCKDGSYKWLSWNSSPDIEQKLVYFVARDITKQVIEDNVLKSKFSEIEKEVQLRTSDLVKINTELRNEINTKEAREKELHESKERVRLVTDNLSEVVWLRSPDNTRFIFINPAFEVVWGIPCEQLYENPMLFIEMIHPEDKKTAIDDYIKCLENGNFVRRYRIVRPDGQIRWIAAKSHTVRDDQGEIIGHVGSATDITERLMLEENIIESKRMYESVVDTQQELICRFLPDTTLTFVNNSYCKAYGKQRSELLGEKYLMLLPNEVHEKELAAIESLSSNHPMDTREYELTLPDGRIIWQNWTNIIIYDESGERKEIQGTGYDITERKQAEVEVRSQTERAEALLRISSKLNAELELDKVQSIVCEEARRALQMEMSAFLRYDPNTRLYHLSASSSLPVELARAFETMDQSDIDVLLTLRKSDIIPNLSTVSELHLARTLMRLGFSTFAYTLVERDGLPIGVLIIGDDKSTVLDVDYIELLSGISNQAASAITNAQMFTQANNRLKQVQALRNIDLAITGSLDLRVTFQVVLDEITEILQSDAAAILRLDPYTGILKYVHWRGFRSKEIDRIILPLNEGYPGNAAKAGESVYIKDLRETEWEINHKTLLTDEGFVAYYAVPLIVKGATIGVLEVLHRELHVSNNEWLSFLESFAVQAAIAIDNADLFSKMKRSNVDLLQAYDRTIQGWAHALDLKDEETADHSQRVTELTLRLSEKMGIRDEELSHVRRGALLHDIGKIGVPDSILLKPGALTSEEWKIMREHPVNAFMMISPIDYLRQALDIPYCHHEKWDGSGYPRGLKGEQIPLAARIFAVVDVYDALTSDRPYRKAWTKEKTMMHIQEQSGKHFDPQILKVFVKEMSSYA